MNPRIVTFKNQVIAYVFFANLKVKGTKFFTPEDYSLQVGLIDKQKGDNIKKHIHQKEAGYNIDMLQEFLYIIEGKVKIRLFSDKWDLIENFVLLSGDFILFVSGGHSVEVLENCKMIIIKQGSYPGEKIAKVFKKNR